jgi:group I intron endonuclease
MSYGIIYKATGPGGRVYIGQTVKTLKTRKSGHKTQSLKGDRRAPFQVALLDEGFSNFSWEQIDTADSKEELDQKEKNYIEAYQADNPAYGYNQQDGGQGGRPGAETRKKMSRARKGKSKSEEHRRKIGEANKNPSPETRRKISMGHKGIRRTEEYRRKMSEIKIGLMKGERHHNVKITEATARAIKTDLKNGMRVCEAKRKYNVLESIVKNIKAGTSWAWLDV